MGVQPQPTQGNMLSISWGLSRDRVSSYRGWERCLLPGLATCPQLAFGSEHMESAAASSPPARSPHSTVWRVVGHKGGEVTHLQMKDGRRLLRGAPPEGLGAPLPFGKQSTTWYGHRFSNCCTTNKTTQVTGNLLGKAGQTSKEHHKLQPQGRQKGC